MAKCNICGKEIQDGASCHFVKIKGQRRLRWYCENCVKGGPKHDASGKRH